MSNLRKYLARYIEKAFKDIGRDVFVDPDELYPATGFYRTGGGDFYRWEGQAQVLGTDTRLSLSSYTTMSQILNSKGAQVVQDKTHPYSYDVYDATGN